MHEQGICHRDLKPDNILMSSDYSLRIADFGFAAPTLGRDGSGKMHTRVGTVDYMAPEIHLGIPYDGKSDDLFAAGIILFMMLTARPPFRCAMKDDPYYKLIVAKRFDLFWQAQTQASEDGEDIYSDDFKNLFEHMCAFNPKERLNWDQIYKHAWMKGPTCGSDEIKADFKRRKALVEAEALDRQEEKRSARVSRSKDSAKSKVSRGEADQDPAADELRAKLDAWACLEMPDFKEYCADHSVTRVFTTADPIETFWALVQAVDDKNEDNWCEVSAEKLKAKYKKIIMSEDEEAEESKSASGGTKAVILVSATICKVSDAKYCVDFVLKNGSRLAFLEHFWQLREQSVLTDYINAINEE